MSDNGLQQDVTMRLLEISVVVLKFLVNSEPARLVELFADFVNYMHVQIDSLRSTVVE